MVECQAGSASRMIDNDCGCHLLVEDTEILTQYGTAVKLKFQVLAATDAGQVGKIQTEIFNVDDGRVDAFYNVAESCGLVSADQRKQAAEAGTGLSVDETQLKGRQLCAQIKMEPNMRKNPTTGATEVNPEKPGPYPKIGFRSFAVTSDKARDIPKDPQFLAMLGKGGAAPSSQPTAQQPAQPTTQQPTPPPPQTNPPAAGGMNWG